MENPWNGRTSERQGVKQAGKEGRGGAGRGWEKEAGGRTTLSLEKLRNHVICGAENLGISF